MLILIRPGKSMTGNFNLYLKAAVLGLSFIGLYIHLIFFTPGTALAIFECVLLGCVISAIGFNIMHDGAHGSFSKSKWVNHGGRFLPEYSGRKQFYLE